MDLPGIYISDYQYDLPEEAIAQYPLADRDRSRLLVAAGGRITETRFYRIADHLPKDSLLVCNDTRVIFSRLLFQKDTGAQIEIFCLDPLSPGPDIGEALRSGPGCEWNCMVGNAKKWKKGALSLKTETEGDTIVLKAIRTGEGSGHWTVRFEWNNPDYCWAQILDIFGKAPLPPYIKRASGASDRICYQTVYAANEGSVAAPTAGLHFTPGLMKNLEDQGIRHTNLTLHVGEGTFKPVSTPLVNDHSMHSERISISRETLEEIAGHIDALVSVGTTSLRTLESLYWVGVRSMLTGNSVQDFVLGQWEPYQKNLPQDIPPAEAFKALLSGMEKEQIEVLRGETSLIIVPVYRVRTSGALITNFHQPRSTLLLLVAAFAGPIWREAYNYALDNNFRFLSYGDACLFFRQ